MRGPVIINCSEFLCINGIKLISDYYEWVLLGNNYEKILNAFTFYY